MRAKPKILVVDDQAFFTTMVRNMLEQRGYEVFVANDGATGLERAREHAPDAIVLDVAMPGMDGFAVCEKLKQDAELKSIPVIFVTGTQDTKLNEKAFKAGGAVTVLKNIPAERWVNMLALAISQGKSTQA